MRIELPYSVRKIIGILEENGYEAFAVGGCVRDSLLGREPKDWDITTSARPEQVKAFFHRTIDTGLQHGTVTVLMNHEGFEVTTYRIDGEYMDGRHPKEVVFTSNLVEDLKRRDFTINAMAYSDRTGIVDAFDGMGDLKRGVIKCVGEAKERFGEDALRILRAVRFSAQLGFQIEEKTWSAICAMSENLKQISRERIQAELDKLLLSEHPDRVDMLRESGIIRAVFEEEETEKPAEDTLADTFMRSVREHYVRWAIFITFFRGKELLKSLKFDNQTIHICERLRRYYKEPLSADEPAIRRLAVQVGVELFEPYYLNYRRALGNASGEMLLKVSAGFERINAREDCLCMRNMAVNGSDLKAIGIPGGREMGKILEILFDAVIEDETKNQKAVLLELAQNEWKRVSKKNLQA